MDKELIQKAIEIFGNKIVQEVLYTVEMSDPDGAFVLFEDMGQFDYAECIEFLYFN